MSTSVKLAEDAKKRLEKLQALMILRQGPEMTQQELLDRLIARALEEPEAFLDKLVLPSMPISDSEYGKILSLIDDWGVTTSWEDVDRLLYGKDTNKGKK